MLAQRLGAALLVATLVTSLPGCCRGEYAHYRAATPSEPSRLTAQAVFYTRQDAKVLEPDGMWSGSLVVTMSHPEWCRFGRIRDGWSADPLHKRAAEIAAAHGGTHLRLVDEGRSFCDYGYNGPCAQRLPTAQYYVLRVERDRWAALPSSLQPR